MKHLKNIEGIEITFLERILIPLWFIYEVKLKNINDKKVKYNIEELQCNAGVNALQLGYEEIEGFKLLTNGYINKNESITGYIAYQMIGIIFTNQPSFRFTTDKNNKIQLKPSHLVRGERYGRN